MNLSASPKPAPDPRQTVSGEPVTQPADHVNRELSTPPTYPEALVRLEEAEETLRAIGVGEIDAFVVSDGTSQQRVFTLSTADRPYRRFVEEMRDGAATLSPDGVILYANRRLAELVSASRADILGSRLTAFMNVDVNWDFLRGSEGRGSTTELDLIDIHGQRIPVLVGVSPLGEDGDRLTCLTFTDLTAQKEQDREIARLSQAQADRMADLQNAQAALVKQATHDPLTGLPNRDVLVDRLDQALLQGARSGRCTAVYFIDLDSFKQVNDTRGHAMGNEVLRDVADRLLVAMRDMDTVARIGGDEFVVLAPDVASHADAVDIGTRLVQRLGRASPSVTAAVSVSVGVAISEGGRGNAELILHEADTAMYFAKSQGGGRSAVFEGVLARRMTERSSSHSDLQSALDEHRILAYYQPIVELVSGSVIGFEALARLIQPDGKVLPPASFIAVAEATGLVLPLGLQMLEQASEQAVLWSRDTAQDGAMTVAVNVSARQLERGGLPAAIRKILARTALAPRRLHLELTETAIMDLDPAILDQLSRIRDLGVQIGLDDFGTGYASLTHLRRLPLDFVKVDRSFVNGLAYDRGDQRIVGAVIDLARNLGLRSIAEGVETAEQLSQLRALGCDQAQGYLFGRPAPPDDLHFPPIAVLQPGLAQS